jgi:hypothetical protein
MMHQLLTFDELNVLINELEMKQQVQWKSIKYNLSLASEKLQPLHIVKNSLNEVVGNSPIANSILQGLLGLGAGYLSKTLLNNASHAKFKHLILGVLQAEISPQEKKQADAVYLIGKLAYSMFGAFSKK